MSIWSAMLFIIVYCTKFSSITVIYSLCDFGIKVNNQIFNVNILSMNFWIILKQDIGIVFVFLLENATNCKTIQTILINNCIVRQYYPIKFLKTLCTLKVRYAFWIWSVYYLYNIFKYNSILLQNDTGQKS